jgi:hypothetical protein
MANINNMPMKDTLLGLSDIAIKKAFLGLSTDIIFKNTESPLKGYELYYSSKELGALNSLIDGSPEKLDVEYIKGKLAAFKESGSILLDVCMSKDKKFIGIQILQYSDFQYKPLSKSRFFENDEAAHIEELLPIF